jgi:DUF917 family protein
MTDRFRLAVDDVAGTELRRSRHAESPARVPGRPSRFCEGNRFPERQRRRFPADTLRHLEDDFHRNLKLGWTDLDEIPDDTVVVCTNFSGSIAPNLDRAGMEESLGVKRTVERPLVLAVRELEGFLGEPIGAIISIEIGGINAGHALDAAANLGLPIVDADYAGRAIPEANCITPNLFGKPLYPRLLIDFYGDVLYLKTAQNNRMVERIGKSVSVAALGIVGGASIPLRAKEVKEIAIPGTLTECLEIGRSLRHAREEGRDPIEALAGHLPDTWVLFRGSISSRRWESRAGYMWGEHEVDGEGDFSGQRLRIWYKNENHVTWLNGEPYVCSPDIIEVVDGETGDPLVNTDLQEGQKIAVIGVKRRAQFDNPRGLEVLGPQHWGFDIPFRPIESLVGPA